METATREVRPYLSGRHPHVRDSEIVFYEKEHVYTILCDAASKYTSVTTWIHSLFEEFDADAIIGKMMRGRNWRPGHKYWGKTPEQIKKQWDDTRDLSSRQGTEMHLEIECFYNRTDHTQEMVSNGTHLDLLQYYRTPLQKHVRFHQTTEWNHFLAFVQDTPELEPYRTEWMVWDEDVKLAGSIDMVFRKPNGALAIYDWKRVTSIQPTMEYPRYSHCPLLSTMLDNNYHHYALQLNVYRHILRRKYGVEVEDLYLVRLHPMSSTYECIPMPDLSATVAKLFAWRERGFQEEDPEEKEEEVVSKDEEEVCFMSPPTPTLDKPASSKHSVKAVSVQDVYGEAFARHTPSTAKSTARAPLFSPGFKRPRVSKPKDVDSDVCFMSPML